ncbi:hypothetical protein NMY22_g7024 [Coprinellus aureogranulatus]|nr:hypothetical protein NMY22_g7024 [Coprinellus aureogranulatus]
MLREIAGLHREAPIAHCVGMAVDHTAVDWGAYGIRRQSTLARLPRWHSLTPIGNAGPALASISISSSSVNDTSGSNERKRSRDDDGDDDDEDEDRDKLESLSQRPRKIAALGTASRPTRIQTVSGAGKPPLNPTAKLNPRGSAVSGGSTSNEAADPSKVSTLCSSKLGVPKTVAKPRVPPTFRGAKPTSSLACPSRAASKPTSTPGATATARMRTTSTTTHPPRPPFRVAPNNGTPRSPHKTTNTRRRTRADPSVSAFFEPLLKDVARKPVEFADGVKRRKRILEELPIAPPLEPRKPSAAELALQEENDQKTMTILKFRLGPILQEMKRKFKRFTKRASEEYNFEPDENGVGYALEVNTTAGAAPPAQPHTNGVIDITGDAPATQPADQQEGPAVQQVMLQRPPLYDMDLDRMHSLLYKGHYLTPQSFLDDVGKMVHNADVRSHEDLDRLHKAQAMFTAAQVSLLEFDATFRMECERMAVREQQRMEAQNKDKGKGKEKGSRNASEERADVPQTRRSTRSNGFAAELVTMTDPVKLERRLKRQREAGEGSGAERDTSADADDGGIGVNGEPNSKRSKMVVDDEDDLNIRTPQSQRHVRFGTGMPDIMNPLPGHPHGPGGYGVPNPSPLANYQIHHQHQQHHPPSMFNNGPSQQHFQQQPNHHIQPQPPHFNGQPPPQPHFYPPSGQMGTHSSYQQPRNHGFDPTLLNPTSPTREFAPGFHNAMHHTPHGHPQGMGMSPMPQANLFNQPGPSSHMQNYRQPEHAAYPQQQFQGPPQNWGEPRPQQPQPLASPMPAMFNDPNDPFAAPPQPQQPQYSEVPQQSNHLQVPPEPSRVNRTPSPNRLQSILRNSKTPDPERRGTPNGVSVEQQLASNENASQQQETNEATTEDTSNAMVVERSPSPPLPDFHLSEDLLQELRTKLTEKTGSLTIEQLEQLRATCLGEVWRQRKEWDRDPLVHALSKMVDEFLEEVKELEEWDEE